MSAPYLYILARELPKENSLTLGWGEGIFARPRFRRFFFHRRNFSYFALRNAPPIQLRLTHPPIRAQHQGTPYANYSM